MNKVCQSSWFVKAIYMTSKRLSLMSEAIAIHALLALGTYRTERRLTNFPTTAQTVIIYNFNKPFTLPFLKHEHRRSKMLGTRRE